MEIYQYLQILRQPNKTWIFSKDTLEAKLQALSAIALDGHPSSIPYLIDFLKDSHPEIRQACSRAITHLLSKMEHRKDCYAVLKHCNISPSDLNVYAIHFSGDELLELWKIASFNKSGFVREKAIHNLGACGNPQAIPCILYRLADWVTEVRGAALKALELYKSSQFIDALIDNLPIFEWLQKVERTSLNAVYDDIIRFIIQDNRAHVVHHFKNYPEKIRLLVSKHLSASFSGDYQGLSLLMSDPNFLIRNRCNDHFEQLTAQDVERLLRDPATKVRLQTLHHLKGRGDFENTVRDFLADSAASIRNFARFSLKSILPNVADIYHQNLRERKQIPGSLTGLAEVGAKPYAATVQQFLTDEPIKIRKTAFLALKKLDEERAYAFALENLDHPLPGIRGVVIEFLSGMPRTEVLEKARDCFRTGGVELKKSMLRLFSKIGGWTAIPDLILGSIDLDEGVRQASADYLQTWKTRAARLFSTPKPEEIERFKKVFELAQEIQQQQVYFKESPIKGLDFYFRDR